MGGGLAMLVTALVGNSSMASAGIRWDSASLGRYEWADDSNRTCASSPLRVLV